MTEDEQHQKFQEKFKSGKCSFCGKTLTSFDISAPCRHWLLKPDGFRKEHFEILAKEHGWNVLEDYLRWVANEDAFARNINDFIKEAPASSWRYPSDTRTSRGLSPAGRAILADIVPAAKMSTDANSSNAVIRQ
jgi:hypothetical protein